MKVKNIIIKMSSYILEANSLVKMDSAVNSALWDREHPGP